MFEKMLALLGKTGTEITLSRFAHDDLLAFAASDRNMIVTYVTTKEAPATTPLMRASLPGDSLVGAQASSVSDKGDLIIDGEVVKFAAPDAETHDKLMHRMKSFILPAMNGADLVEDEAELAALDAHKAAGSQFSQFVELLGDPLVKKTRNTAVVSMPGADGSMYYAITLRIAALVMPQKQAEPVKTEPKAKPKPKQEEPVEQPVEAPVDTGVLGDDDAIDAMIAQGVQEAEAQFADPIPAEEPAAPVSDDCVCGNKAPDGRACTKPKGHEGKHWYGGAAKAPAEAKPVEARQEPAPAPAQAVEEPTALAGPAPVKSDTLESVINGLETEFLGFVARTKEMFKTAKLLLKEKGKAKDKSEALKKAKQALADLIKQAEDQEA